MTDGYDCYQNALAERVNGILKHELKDITEAKTMVAESIHIYNAHRPHLSLQYKTLKLPRMPLGGSAVIREIWAKSLTTN